MASADGETLAGPGNLIELRVSVPAESIAAVRLVAADLAARADFGLDTIDDVRMAVDEVCNQLACRADRTQGMRIVFHLDGHGGSH